MPTKAITYAKCCQFVGIPNRSKNTEPTGRAAATNLPSKLAYNAIALTAATPNPSVLSD